MGVGVVVLTALTAVAVVAAPVLVAVGAVFPTTLLLAVVGLEI